MTCELEGQHCCNCKPPQNQSDIIFNSVQNIQYKLTREEFKSFTLLELLY